jgi:endonuclease/exonuclease/phosphatase family metal-dependent hydrolase
MKIISLNTFSGRIYEPLMKFFTEHQDVDVFCLQEIHHESEGKEKVFLDDAFNLFNDIRNVLPNHTGIFQPNLEDFWGLAMFIKKDIHVVSVESIKTFYHDESKVMSDDNYPRHLQHVTLELNGEQVSIINLHGVHGAGKMDTPERLEQFSNTANVIKSIDHNYIVCGDFNLLPDTESLKMIEQTGLVNLIKKYNITSTRTATYTKPNKYADYVLVSPNVEVINFTVLPDEVSDHAPLYLEIK